MTKYCGICNRELDTDDPLSNDCGGDCWGCISQIEADGLNVDVVLYRADPGKYLDWSNSLDQA